MPSSPRSCKEADGPVGPSVSVVLPAGHRRGSRFRATSRRCSRARSSCNGRCGKRVGSSSSTPDRDRPPQRDDDAHHQSRLLPVERLVRPHLGHGRAVVAGAPCPAGCRNPVVGDAADLGHVPRSPTGAAQRAETASRNHSRSPDGERNRDRRRRAGCAQERHPALHRLRARRFTDYELDLERPTSSE